MRCLVCNDKQATMHLMQLSGPVLMRGDYCERCAKELGLNVHDKKPIDLFQVQEAYNTRQQKWLPNA